MAKKEKHPQKELTVFPSFHDFLRSRFAGLWVAGTYFVLMLYIGLRYHIVGDYHVETDFFQVYVVEAKNIFRGIWEIDDFRGPGYPMLLGAIGLFTSNLFQAGIVTSTLTGAVVLFFIFELLKKLFRADLAIVVTLLTAVNKTFVQYTYTAGTDMTFNAFVMTTLYFLVHDDKRVWWKLFASSFFAAMAYLTRYNGVFVFLAAPVMILWINIYSLDRKDRIITTLAFLGGFFLCIAPWGTYTLMEKGSFFYNKNYLNIAYEMFAKGKVGWDQYWNVEAAKYPSLLHVISADPSLFISTLIGNMYDHFTKDLELLLGWGTGILFLAGIVGMWTERPTRNQLAVYLFGLSFFLVLLLVFYGERFSLFLIPIYSAIGINALLWKRWKGVPFFNGTVIVAVLLVWSFRDSYTYNAANIDSGPKEIIAIANFFNTNVNDQDENKIVVCRKPHIAYYINKTMKYFPYVDSWEQLEQETKKVGADYFFYGVFEANMRPQFQQLLDPRKSPDWLEPITFTTNPPSVLYRVKD